ncbi:C40 family peptidase [bacterium]|nr:C40 family peptidase [bacterium]
MISNSPIPFIHHQGNIQILFFHIIITFMIFLGCSTTVNRRRTESYPHDRTQLQQYAESFLGTPYQYGGTDRSGMDCSGLVVRIYKDIYGLNLPHSTEELNKRGTPVHLRSAEVGDLVFFRENRRSPPSHVGIYMGQDTFIHVSSSQGVILSSLEDDYYRIRFYEIRRING